MAVAVAVAVAVSGGGAVAVAGLTKRFFNHIQKDFLINVWGYCALAQSTLAHSEPALVPWAQSTLAHRLRLGAAKAAMVAETMFRWPWYF